MNVVLNTFVIKVKMTLIYGILIHTTGKLDYALSIISLSDPTAKTPPFSREGYTTRAQGKFMDFFR